MDFRLTNGKPKATLIQRFDGSILLITPRLEKMELDSLREALYYADHLGFEINIEHLHPAGGEG
jgi:hypothetical protein